MAQKNGKTFQPRLSYIAETMGMRVAIARTLSRKAVRTPG
jgi:hypothetical protein